MPMKNKQKIRKPSGLERAAHSLDFSPQQLKNFVSAGYLPQPKQLDFHAAALRYAVTTHVSGRLAFA